MWKKGFLLAANFSIMNILCLMGSFLIVRSLCRWRLKYCLIKLQGNWLEPKGYDDKLARWFWCGV